MSWPIRTSGIASPQNVRLSDDKDIPEIRVISGDIFVRKGVRKSMFGKGGFYERSVPYLSKNSLLGKRD